MSVYAKPTITITTTHALCFVLRHHHPGPLSFRRGVRSMIQTGGSHLTALALGGWHHGATTTRHVLGTCSLTDQKTGLWPRGFMARAVHRDEAVWAAGQPDGCNDSRLVHTTNLPVFALEHVTNRLSFALMSPSNRPRLTTSCSCYSLDGDKSVGKKRESIKFERGVVV